MTPDEKLVLLKKLVVAYAAFYRENLAPVVVQMYAEDLSGCELDDLKRVLVEIRGDRKITRLPLPAEILNRIRPALSDDNIAREVAGRIIAAVSRFGPYQTEKAREHTGTVGWEVVKRQGGWGQVCQTLGVSLSIDNAQAQWRELAKSILEQQRAGVLGTAPELPMSPEGRKRIADMVQGSAKRLPGPEGERE